MTPTATPRPWSTQRDPAWATEGGEIARLARVMGKPFMPHQRYIADVATERDSFGRYRYRTVLITLPRQSGKTTLLGPVQMHRIITRPRIKAFFTAQTGKDARSRFKDLTNLVTESPLAPLAKLRFAQGSEGVHMPNGSSLNVFSPTPSAMHGETPHLVTLDEIWKHDTIRGNELMGAIRPAQITLGSEAQIFMVSTMGTAMSGFMNDLIDVGRSGSDPSMCYIEYSLPDGLDPLDRNVYELFHPAIGITISLDDFAAEVRAEAAKNYAEMLRAYMNRRTEAVDPIIPAEAWAALRRDDELHGIPSRRELALSYEVAPDNASAVVMASWRDADGAPSSRIVHAAPGTAWLVDLVLKLRADWQPASLAADDGGPTRRVNAEIRQRIAATEGADVAESALFTTRGTDYSTACDAWLTYARDDRTFRHDGSRTFAAAVQHLVIARMGDAIKFSRKDSTGPIAAAIASAVGLWAYDHRPRPIGKPVLRF